MADTLWSIDKRLRLVSVHRVGYGSGSNGVSSVDTGFFRNVASESSCRFLVGEAVGKTRRDPWRALLIRLPEGDATAAVVRLRSVYPAEVSGSFGPLDVRPDEAGVIRIPLKAGESALVATKYAASDLSPSMDRSKFLIGTWGGMSEKTRGPRHIQWLHEAGIDFFHTYGRSDSQWKDSYDLLHERGMGVIVKSLGYWSGGSGKRAGQMRSMRPFGRYEDETTALMGPLKHPAIWMVEISDEPSALDMEYLGEISAMVNRRNPEIPAYINLYPNYAQVSWNTSRQQTSQLGTRTYAEYIDEYCRTMPSDIICYDHYPIGGDEEFLRLTNGPRMYANLGIVADACRRTGRSFWLIPQVNSKPKYRDRLTEGNFRFQAAVAMAYGCEAILWATWNHAFWTNSVLTVEGERSDHYGKIRKVNAEVHRLGAEYMRFRNVDTKLCCFPAREAKVLSKRGVRTFSGFSGRGVRSLRVADGTAFVAGEMVSRDENDFASAVLVVPADDMFDGKRKTRKIRFAASGKVKVFGFDGPIACSADASGCRSFDLKDGYAALIVVDQADDGGFQSAKPVWPKSRRLEMNTQVRFDAGYRGAEKAVLRVASSNPYRIRLNGKFAGYGPARGPKGLFRVDEWPLSGIDGANRVEIEVAGYNASSYYFQNQPSFIKAEIYRGREVLAATGVGGAFTASDTDRLQKTVRFSGQRMFTEVYRVGSSRSAAPQLLEECPAVRHLPRIAPYPDFQLNKNLKVMARSKAVYDSDAVVRPNRHADWMPGRDHRTAFAKTELEVNSWAEAERTKLSGRKTFDALAATGFSLDRESVTVDVGLNDCGFPGMTVDVEEPGRLLFMFDEILSDGRVDYSRMKCVNVIEWFFDRPGRYEIESFEPYGFRYAEIAVPDGKMKISGLYVRAYKNPDAGKASFRCSDPALDRIFTAARETFVQNAVDVFTDCPGRERAGWLCDSFFIGRVNHLLTGNTESERLFLQNYALPESFDHIPQGMVPMCYPGDHPTGRFIPNWAMWLVLQTEEYLHRSGDRETVELLRPRLLGLYDYLKGFYNSDGLLEKLPQWVFIEWSKSNRLVQDVNYPSNMMWAEVLECLDRLYGRPDLSAESKRIRETVRRQSWTGKWFCDNAKRMKDGTLKPTGICTETCQYYAFFFRTATPETHPELWRTLLDDFGPKRKETGMHPDIAYSNAFIGNYLRLELLSRAGLVRKIVEETRGYFLSMADRTGTLWEHDSPTASCCHGFASHVAVCLFRDILGVRSVDGKTRTAEVSPSTDIGLDWCEGEFPVSADETLHVKWKKDGKVQKRWKENK